MRNSNGWLGRFAARISGLVAIGMAIVFLLIRPYVLGTFTISSGSMHPTLASGDVVFVNNFIYRFREPRLGEVVVFRSPVDGEDWIKRIVGLPGDRLEIRGGALYRNGEPVDEPYVSERTGDMYPVSVPPGAVFVMGDNRNDSEDSRDWGPLEEKRLVGQATMIFLPFNRAGYID
ncbi:MAG: signal peptidase I [Armatimonadota bacterium]